MTEKGSVVSERLKPLLRCPMDGSRLSERGDSLVSEGGTAYPVVQGVPVLLTENDDPTLWVARASYQAAREDRPADALYEDTLGAPVQHDRLRRPEPDEPDARVDPVISRLVGATCGFLYTEQIGRLREVPIPELRMPDGDGLLLDVGCGWGRWSVAAARKGYRPVGIDPSLGAVLAAQRLCRDLGVEADFVVGDALRLPFADRCFDVIFSYSVLQHFSYENAEAAIVQAARVAKPDAELRIQMPNAFGVRCLYHQARRRFRPPRRFDVRYYSPSRLRRTFAEHFGETRLEVDGFFGLGVQPSDRRMLPPAKRLVVTCSELLRAAAKRLPPLANLADSLYVVSDAKKRGGVAPRPPG